MCMTFGYNPQINFVTFSQFELSHFWAQLLLKLMDIRYLVSATVLLQFYLNPFETLQVFLSRTEDVHDICYNPQVNFVTFFTV